MTSMNIRRLLLNCYDYLNRTRDALLLRKKPTIASYAPTDGMEVIQSLCYSELRYLNANHYKSFHSYLHAGNFAYHLGCLNILEIGAGLSTAIWGGLAARTGANVCTIDADFDRLQDRVGYDDEKNPLGKNARLIKGATIETEELLEFYSQKRRSSFAGIEIASLAKRLDLFLSRNCPDVRWKEVTHLAGRKRWSIADLVVFDDDLIFSRQLLDIFSMDKSFDSEIAFLDKVAEKGESGVLDDLIAESHEWDLVFFDSGELSSTIEWLKVKDHIAVGGLAIFHDIFFPKSIKNVVACASIVTNPNWRIVFVDDSTKQGLMVAQRLQ